MISIPGFRGQGSDSSELGFTVLLPQEKVATEVVHEPKNRQYLEDHGTS